MAQLLGALVTLTQDSGSQVQFPAQTRLHSRRQCPLLASAGTRHSYGTNIHMQANTHTHEINKSFKKKKKFTNYVSKKAQRLLMFSVTRGCPIFSSEAPRVLGSTSPFCGAHGTQQDHQPMSLCSVRTQSSWDGKGVYCQEQARKPLETRTPATDRL